VYHLSLQLLLYPLLQNSVLGKNSTKTRTYHRKPVKTPICMWSVVSFWAWKTNTTPWNITVHKHNRDLRWGVTFEF